MLLRCGQPSLPGMICILIVLHGLVSWYAENMENDGLFALPVEGPILRGHKRKFGQCGAETGAVDESTTSFALAGSWMTLKNLRNADLTLATDDSDDAEALAWKTTTKGLAARLKEQGLQLVDVDGRLRVLD